jgi:5-(carboxyamino)imidazole ribonucleotide synthase
MRPAYLDTVADFIVNTRLADLNADALEHGRWILADCIPVVAAGMQTREMKAFVAAQLAQAAPGNAWVLGTGKRASALDAGLLNGTAGTWLELDEGNLFAKGHPGIQVVPAALAVAQDRLLEKTLFRDLGIPTPPFAPVDLRQDLEAAVARIGLPGILKTRRFGYDGKGQARIRTRADVATAWAALGGEPLIYEGFVRFSREVSLVGARSTRGERAYYPLAENVHEHGILSVTRAPFTSAALQRAAQRHMRAVLDHFGYVGVLAIEFFVERGRLVANEMAPRVHNSGHWTIEGAETSQFENHLRAILGLPLGATGARGYAAMLNFVGRLPDRAQALAVPGLHLHDYGKREARPGRKLGHATVVAPSARAREAALRRLLRLR